METANETTLKLETLKNIESLLGDILICLYEIRMTNADSTKELKSELQNIRNIVKWR